MSATNSQYETSAKNNAGADLGGGCRGCTPPPPRDYLQFSNITGILQKKTITKTESNNCFIIHCFEENNDKRIIAAITVYFQTLKNVQLSDKQIFTVFIKEIMHCTRNLQIIH